MCEGGDGWREGGREMMRMGLLMVCMGWRMVSSATCFAAAAGLHPFPSLPLSIPQSLSPSISPSLFDGTPELLRQESWTG